MRRIVYTIFLTLCLVLPSLAHAIPIITTKTSMDLSQLSFTSTGSLDVEFDLSGSLETVAMIYSGDIQPCCDDSFFAENSSSLNFSYSFTASGDGYLSTDFAVAASQTIADWGAPDGIYGPDPHFWTMSISNTSTDQSVHEDGMFVPYPHVYDFSYSYDLDKIFFGNGQSGRLDLYLKAYSGWRWNQKPSEPNTPVPEPATMILLGLGLSGVAVINRRKARFTL